MDSEREQVKELISSALTIPLNPKQQQQLINKIKSSDLYFFNNYNILPTNVWILIILFFIIIIKLGSKFSWKEFSSSSRIIIKINK